MLIVRAFPVRSRAAVEQFVRELSERADEVRRFYESFGIGREAWFFQRRDDGEIVIAVTQADEPVAERAEAYAAAQEGFPAWFKRQVMDISGVDPNLTPLGPPTELVFDSGGGGRIEQGVPLIVSAYPLKSREAIEAFVEQLHQRPDETRGMYERLGVRTTWHVQETGRGAFTIAVAAMADPLHTAELYASASDPFTIWFKKRANEITGLNPERLPLGPETEKVFDYVG